ncbi:OFA family MFS transporter [uncultured Fusobacterium sp.]|uniref:L-lactate MFS transporter n=1 Tax=uncultured Fusobacterium sp. TaxID=159267 RepID=UPI00262616E8|nr:OFA family MFS transporter [uncultured Fusobacterium sp.]
MNLTKKRWNILFVCCLVNLCLGSIYTWSVFASPMAHFLSERLGQKITSADLAIVYTVANSVGPITMISGGWINDKFGPKKVIFIGGLMFGLGMFLSGYAESINFLMVTYGLIYGLGLGMAYGTTISSCIKFFPDKRGLIGGITTALYGCSSVILPPIITILVTNYGVTATFKIVGIIFAIVVCLASFFIEQCPADFIPEGWNPKVNATQGNVVNKDWKEMLKSLVFYLMMLILCCGAFSVAQHMIGMSLFSASTAVSVIALFNVFGRIIAGYLSDKIGRITTLALSCVLSLVGMLILYSCSKGTVVLFYIGAAIVGLCFGSFMGVFPGFTADKFGPKNNSVNFGIMFIGFAISGYFGPTVMSNIYRSTGEYQEAFLIAVILNIVGIVLSFIYTKVNKKITG